MSLPSQGSQNRFRVGSVAGISTELSPWYGLLVVFVALRVGVGLEFLAWLGVLTLSIWIHEMGHALTAKHYGLAPRIVIHAVGGYCEHRPTDWRQADFRIVAAGPAATVGLAMAAWLLAEVLPGGSTLERLARWTASLNAYLAIFNLLPVFPLDGGRLLHTWLGWNTWQNRADGLTWWVSTVVAVLAALAGFALVGSLFAVLLFGLLAWQNGQRARRYRLEALLRPKKRQPSANPGGPGFDLPRPVRHLMGVLLVFAVVSIAIGRSGVSALGVDAGSIVTRPWTAFTYAWLYAPWEWGALAFAVAAVGLFGPPVQRVLGTARFWMLFVAAGWAGALSTLIPGGWMSGPVLGAGSGALALMVAWARFRGPYPVFDGGRVTAWMATGAVCVTLVLLGTTGATDWSWLAHLAGGVLGLLVPIPRPAEPPAVDLTR